MQSVAVFIASFLCIAQIGTAEKEPAKKEGQNTSTTPYAPFGGVYQVPPRPSWMGQHGMMPIMMRGPPLRQGSVMMPPGRMMPWSTGQYSGYNSLQGYIRPPKPPQQFDDNGEPEEVSRMQSSPRPLIPPRPRPGDMKPQSNGTMQVDPPSLNGITTIRPAGQDMSPKPKPVTSTPRSEQQNEIDIVMTDLPPPRPMGGNGMMPGYWGMIYPRPGGASGMPPGFPFRPRPGMQQNRTFGMIPPSMAQRPGAKPGNSDNQRSENADTTMEMPSRSFGGAGMEGASGMMQQQGRPSRPRPGIDGQQDQRPLGPIGMMSGGMSGMPAPLIRPGARPRPDMNEQLSGASVQPNSYDNQVMLQLQQQSEFGRQTDGDADQLFASQSWNRQPVPAPTRLPLPPTRPPFVTGLPPTTRKPAVTTRYPPPATHKPPTTTRLTPMPQTPPLPMSMREYGPGADFYLRQRPIPFYYMTPPPMMMDGHQWLNNGWQPMNYARPTQTPHVSVNGGEITYNRYYPSDFIRTTRSAIRYGQPFEYNRRTTTPPSVRKSVIDLILDYYDYYDRQPAGRFRQRLTM